jgi:hypothetical protein
MILTQIVTRSPSTPPTALATWPIEANGSLGPTPELPPGFAELREIAPQQIAALDDENSRWRLHCPQEFERAQQNLASVRVFAADGVKAVFQRSLPAKKSYLAQRLTRLLILPTADRETADQKAYVAEMSELLSEWPADLADQAIQWARRGCRWRPSHAELQDKFTPELRQRAGETEKARRLLKSLSDGRAQSLRALPSPRTQDDDELDARLAAIETRAR